MSDQQLTGERREAHWRALERMRQSEKARIEEREVRAIELAMCRRSESECPLCGWAHASEEAPQGKRPDQLEYSLLVVAVLAICGAAGVAIGAAVALLEAVTK